MRLQEHIDFTTLPWLKPGLEEAFAHARRELESHAEQPGHGGSMHACARSLHQIQGGLRMVELYGAAMVAAEMEALAEAVAAGWVARHEEACAVLMRGLMQLPDYLERLNGGHRDVPVVLLPLLNDLRASRGEPALPESALFTPPLDMPLPEGAPGALGDATAEQRRGAVAQLRPRFQQQLLGWFRGQTEPRELAGMRETLDAIAGQCLSVPGRRLWWIAAGVIEGLEQDVLREQANEARQLIGRVDRSIRQLIEQGEDSLADDDATELARRLLHLVARTRRSTPRLELLRRTYRLHGLLPDPAELQHARGSMAGHNRALLDAVAKALKDDLLRVKEALDLFLRRPDGELLRLGDQLDVLDRVGDTLDMLMLAQPRRVVDEQRRVLEEIVHQLRPPEPAGLLDIADALLRVEASLDDHIERLGAGEHGRDEAAPPSLPRSEARRILIALMREAIVNIGLVKEAIVAFVESGWEHPRLAPVPGLMNEIAGALRMLSAARPAALVDGIARFVGNEWLGDRKPLGGTQLDQLADALAALEYYLEAARDHRGGLGPILDIVQSSLAALGYWPLPPARYPRAGADVDTPVAAAVQPSEPAPAGPLDPRLVEPGFRHAGEGIDEDLRAIFLEELQEQIGTLRAARPAWLAAPAQAATLVPLRRAFHTLKGSARLLGAGLLGEFAGKLENLLDRVSEQSVAPHAGVCVLVGQAIDALPALGRSLLDERPPAAPVLAIMDVAERLAGGDELARIEDYAGAGEAWPSSGPPPVVIDAAASRGRLDDLVDAPISAPGAVPDDADVLAAFAAEPAPRAASALPPVDAVLLEILRGEVTQHLRTMRAALPRRDGDEAPVDEHLLRAAHTLHGAIAMVDIPLLTGLLSPLESLLKRLRGAGRPLSPEGVGLLARAADAIDQVMAQFGAERPELPLLDDLVARLIELRDAQPEPGITHHLFEPGADEEAGAPTAASMEAQPAAQPTVPAAATESPFAQLDPDLLEIFIEEARDILDHADGELAAWRAAPAEPRHLVSLRRDLHTLKGGARIAGLRPVGDLSHALETLLDKLADGELRYEGTTATALEAGFDQLHALLRRVAQARPIEPAEAMIARLLALSGGSVERAGGGGFVAPARLVKALTGATTAGTSTSPPEPLPESAEEDRAAQEQIRVRADLLDTLVNHAGEVAIYRSRLEQQVAGYRLNLAELERTVTRLRSQLRAMEIETETQIITRFQREHREAGLSAFDPLELDRYSQLQQYSRALAESVSDLVSLQGALNQLTRQAEGLLIQQARAGSELQDGLLRTRMLPFDTMVPNLRRTLRQAGRELGKQAQLHVEGAHGEMDRNLLERIKAPFEHMLRNAMAHGIETPAQRSAAGKPEQGEVRIEVAREATEVVIRVSDDGRGLDREAIRARAIERGLLRGDARIGDEQLLSLITQPGFSTAGELTQLAGRGLGMDVVANEIGRLGGALSVSSTPGRGTTFALRLPFTLAVTQAILVRVGESNFAIPMSSVQGVARIAPEQPSSRLDEAAPRFEHDGESYDIHSLAELLGLPPSAVDEAQPPLLLSRSGELRAAIRIDAVIGSREIVVKSVGPQISSVPGILGATILGDGSVLMILDLAPLVRHGIARRRQRLEDGLPALGAAPFDESRPRPLVMVVDDSITMRKVTGRVLERHEFDVLTAKDGIDALEKLAERVPALILLDIEMPRMDGYELAAHLRDEPRLAGVPIIMITSRSGEKHRQRAFDLGVRDYLGKPYQEAELIARIDDILGLPRRQRPHD